MMANSKKFLKDCESCGSSKSGAASNVLAGARNSAGLRPLSTSFSRMFWPFYPFRLLMYISFIYSNGSMMPL